METPYKEDKFHLHPRNTQTFNIVITYTSTNYNVLVG